MAAALVLALSCNKTVIDENVQDGTLSIKIGNIDQEIVETRTGEYADTYANYNVILSNSAEGKTTWSKKYSEIKNNPQIVAVGEGYSVKVENMTTTEANQYIPQGESLKYGCKHICGTTGNINVTANVNTNVQVACAVDNCQVAVAYSEAFNTAFTNANTLLSDDTKSGLDGDDTTKACFFQAGNTVRCSLTATNSKGEEKNYTKDLDLTGKGGKKITLTFNVTGAEGTITVYVTVSENLVDEAANESVNPYESPAA